MIWILIIIIVVSVGSTVYLGVKSLQAQQQLIRALEALANALQKRQSFDGNTVAYPAESHTTAVRKVVELAPEIIAPNLKTPPRARGGFGTAVRTDDDIQIRQTSGSETRSEGCQIGSGQSDQNIATSAKAGQCASSSDSQRPAIDCSDKPGDYTPDTGPGPIQ